MSSLIPYIHLAGVMHLAVLAANFTLSRRLAVRENAARLSPILRQVFYVHWLYILIVLLIFAALCLFFPGELAGASPLGTFLSACIALFWALRILLQLAVYDAATRRANRFLDALYLLALCYFTAVFTAAVWGSWR